MTKITMTKITLENCYGKFSVESNLDDMDINNIMESLVQPLLLAAGYSIDTTKSIGEQ